MAGIINKIGETLHVGGNKKEDEHKVESHGDYKGERHDEKTGVLHGLGGHKGESHGDYKGENTGVLHGFGEHKPDHYGHGEEHKEGFVDKIKDKIHGDPDHVKGEGVVKKKKDKKKHEHGHEHGHDSSSSDSD
uniref:Dehydrin 132 n=1 Tax=Ammopiptanthus mongolicus TaxID=126911 RepID=A0A346RSN0_AMMMO|nr:dehydrin 132 [Ammopiptanthus mongolicus]